MGRGELHRRVRALDATAGQGSGGQHLLRGVHLDNVDDGLRVLRDEIGLRGIVDLRTATEAHDAREWVGRWVSPGCTCR